MGDKLIESIKTFKFEKDDILVVKPKVKLSMQEYEKIKDKIKIIIPKDLNVKIVISPPEIDLEIIRREKLK